MLNLKSNERSNVWLLTRSPPCEWSTTPRLWEHWGPGHRPAAITSALSNLQKHIKYTFTVLSQIVTGSDKGRSAPTRCRVLLQQMRKEKQGSNRQWRQQAPCVLESFLLQRCLLWCYQSCIDQIWLFYNICFQFWEKKFQIGKYWAFFYKDIIICEKYVKLSA